MVVWGFPCESRSPPGIYSKAQMRYVSGPFLCLGVGGGASFSLRPAALEGPDGPFGLAFGREIDLRRHATAGGSPPGMIFYSCVCSAAAALGTSGACPEVPPLRACAGRADSAAGFRATPALGCVRGVAHALASCGDVRAPLRACAGRADEVPWVVCFEVIGWRSARRVGS